MLALLPTLVSLLLMSLVRIHEPNKEDEKKYLTAFSVVSLIIVVYLLMILILENILTLSTSSRISTFVLLLLLLASPLGIAIKAQLQDLKGAPETSSIESNLLLDNSYPPIEENSLKYEGVTDLDRVEVKVSSSDDHTILLDEEDINLLQAMGTINFWLLFVAMICGMGSGMATINNMNQLGQSFGYSTKEITFFVSLWSIWNFFGRLGAGYLSDIFLFRGWSRPLFIVITLAIMTVGHIIIALGFSGNLYVGSILVGICYGSQWTLMPTVSKEIFGIRHIGTISNTISIACPIGSYIFSVRVIGYIYDKEASGNTSCFGTHCFMSSFIIIATVDFLGCLVAIFLFFRTKRYYQLVVLKRLQVFCKRPILE